MHHPAGTRLDAELATQPRGLRPPSCWPPSAPVAEGRVRRTHQWITLDGARHEPLLPQARSGRRDVGGARQARAS